MLTQEGTQYLVAEAGGVDQTMSKVLAEDSLKEAIAKQSFLIDGELSGVEGIKYDFHSGHRILKASFGRPVNLNDLPAAERNRIFIAPGEVMFVLTRERLNLPKNIMAMLSPKRKLTHGGIMVLGGLAIDPRYRGVLWFGMYNFSSTPYPFIPDRKLIAAVFYELDDAEAVKFDGAPEDEVTDFPDELITLVNQYKPVELKGLQEELSETRRELTALKVDLANDRTWKDDFKRGLDDLKQSVTDTSRTVADLGRNLEREISLRAADDSALATRLTGMSNLFFGLKLGWAAVAVIIVAVIGAVAGHYVTGWFSH